MAYLFFLYISIYDSPFCNIGVVLVTSQSGVATRWHINLEFLMDSLAKSPHKSTVIVQNPVPERMALHSGNYMLDSSTPPILAISDLHGHPDLLIAAIEKGIDLAGRDDVVVVLLGDYVDNGPKIPELLEYLSTESYREHFPNISLHSIMGNHDMACLLSLEPEFFHVSRDKRYFMGLTAFERWTTCFQKYGGVTHIQYGADGETSFLLKFPTHHREWLKSLPLYTIIDQYFFVHAGIRDPSREALRRQMEFLDSKDLSAMGRRHT